MRTPKGWSGPKIVDGEYVEGSFHAHQVPLMAAKTNKDQLADFQKWLLSYGPAKLFTETGDVVDSIKSIIPVEADKRLGQRVETYKNHEVLKVPDWKKYGVEKGNEESCMKAIGNLIDQALVDNPKSLRISPLTNWSATNSMLFSITPGVTSNVTSSPMPRVEELSKSSVNTLVKVSFKGIL